MDAPRRVSVEPLLGDRGLQHDARALAGVLAPRPDSAGVLVPGRRIAAVLDREPAGQGRDASGACSATPSGAARSLILLGIFIRSLERSRPTGPSKTRSRRSASATPACSCWRSPRGACRPRCSWRSSSASGLAFVLYPLPPARFDYAQCRRAPGLAAPLHRVPRPLQHELEPVVGVRRVVPEPVPARVAVPLQRRRLVDAEFHPHAGDDDARDLDGRVAASARTKADKLKGLVVAGLGLAVAGLLLQWLHLCPIVKRIWTSSYTLYSGGLVLLLLAVVLRGDRSRGLDALVVPAAGHRRQLDCDLRHELDARALRGREPSSATSAAGRSCDLRPAL